jgi:iduronate 2-sulfatase
MPDHLEGISLVALLDNPKSDWKRAAYSLYPRKVTGVGEVMGRTIRTDRFRFVEWTNEDSSFYKTELYDHQIDPDENFNLALNPENKETIDDLSKILHSGWKKALPKNFTQK